MQNIREPGAEIGFTLHVLIHQLRSIVFFPIYGVGSQTKPEIVYEGDVCITGPWEDEEIDLHKFNRVVLFGHINFINCTFLVNSHTIIDFSNVTHGNFENNWIKVLMTYRDFGPISLN